MGRKEDDEKAYTTYDGILGRSIRRGTRRALNALTLGLLGCGDSVRELPVALTKDAASVVSEDAASGAVLSSSKTSSGVTEDENGVED